MNIYEIGKGKQQKESSENTDPAPFSGVLDESFGDATALFNSREWLASAMQDKGAKITGKGCGFGQADIGIELEGCKFEVTIRPL